MRAEKGFRREMGLRACLIPVCKIKQCSITLQKKSLKTLCKRSLLPLFHSCGGGFFSQNVAALGSSPYICRHTVI